MTPPISTRLKMWLLIVGVFILGGVTGVAVDSIYRIRTTRDRPGGMGRRDSAHALEKMKRELNLNDQQATEIRAILDQTGNEYRALRTEVRPRYDAIRQNARTRIRALLNPEQQQKFDAKAAERDARRDNNERDDR